MPTFNLLLKEEGIDPKDVYLVRHQDTRNSRQSVYRLYKSDLRQFEVYQSLQRKNCFGGRPLIASFIAAPTDEGMKKHSTSGDTATILEAVATPTLGELDRLESLWKDKLGSRKWGLNEN